MEEKKMNKNERKRRKVSIGRHQVEIVFQNSIFVNAFIVYCHGSFDSSNSIAPCRSVCVIERFPEVNHRSVKSGRVSFPLSGMDPFICSSSELMTVWSGANLSSWIHKPTRYDTRKEGFFCMIWWWRILWKSIQLAIFDRIDTICWYRNIVLSIDYSHSKKNFNSKKYK